MSFILDPFVTINASNQAYIFMRAKNPLVRRTYYVDHDPAFPTRLAIPELIDDGMGGEKHVEIELTREDFDNTYVKVLEGEELTFPEILPMLMFEQDDRPQARRNEWHPGGYIWWEDGKFWSRSEYDTPETPSVAWMPDYDSFAATDWVLVNPNDAPT
jgi:hypothetical protein